VSSHVTDPRLSRQDYLGALAVFLLVFLCTLPVVLPFLFLQEAWFALRVSNGIAIVMLFLTGYTLGRHSGHPWRVGVSMVVVGLVLVSCWGGDRTIVVWLVAYERCGASASFARPVRRLLDCAFEAVFDPGARPHLPFGLSS
jgi:hypothetical protein